MDADPIQKRLEPILPITMTNLLAIVGSPRKGKATDILVDKAIGGAKSKDPNCNVKKINLIEHDIKFCRNCLACRDIQIHRRFCDDATSLIKQTIKDSLNAKTVGDLYAGDIERRGVEYYFDKAFRLGKRLS